LLEPEREIFVSLLFLDELYLTHFNMKKKNLVMEFVMPNLCSGNEEAESIQLSKVR
jgi:hypothetical protein